MRKNEVAVVEKKENKGLSKVKKAVAAACGAGYMALNAMPMTVFAAGGDTSAITQPLDNLKTLVIAIIGAVGVIILAKCHGVCTGIPAAGFLHNELCLKGNCCRSHDGRYFHGSYLPWILRSMKSLLRRAAETVRPLMEGKR